MNATLPTTTDPPRKTNIARNGARCKTQIIPQATLFILPRRYKSVYGQSVEALWKLCGSSVEGWRENLRNYAHTGGLCAAKRIRAAVDGGQQLNLLRGPSVSPAVPQAGMWFKAIWCLRTDRDGLSACATNRPAVLPY